MSKKSNLLDKAASVLSLFDYNKKTDDLQNLKLKLTELNDI